MRRNDKWSWAIGAMLGFPLMGLADVVAADTVVVSPRQVAPSYYYSNSYYPPTVVVEPLLLPRVGSNDYLYTYDNIYGSGASAAGRLSHTVVNTPPQLFYPRQPRVYLGY